MSGNPIQSPSTIMPTMRYRDAPAAIDYSGCAMCWGSRATLCISGPDNTIGHAELTLGGGMIMLGSPIKDDARMDAASNRRRNVGESRRGARCVIVVDADVVFARAKSAGAGRLCAHCRTPIMGAASSR